MKPESMMDFAYERKEFATYEEWLVWMESRAERQHETTQEVCDEP